MRIGVGVCVSMAGTVAARTGSTWANCFQRVAVQPLSALPSRWTSLPRAPPFSAMRGVSEHGQLVGAQGAAYADEYHEEPTFEVVWAAQRIQGSISGRSSGVAIISLQCFPCSSRWPESIENALCFAGLFRRHPLQLERVWAGRSAHVARVFQHGQNLFQDGSEARVFGVLRQGSGGVQETNKEKKEGKRFD